MGRIPGSFIAQPAPPNGYLFSMGPVPLPHQPDHVKSTTLSPTELKPDDIGFELKRTDWVAF